MHRSFSAEQLGSSPEAWDNRHATSFEVDLETSERACG